MKINSQLYGRKMKCQVRTVFFELAVLQLLFFGCLAQQKPQARLVSGEVTQTSSYCGGARPSDEMVQEQNRPKPYGGKKFYIRKVILY
jgi:hypothetical protein